MTILEQYKELENLVSNLKENLNKLNQMYEKGISDEVQFLLIDLKAYYTNDLDSKKSKLKQLEDQINGATAPKTQPFAKTVTNSPLIKSVVPEVAYPKVQNNMIDNTPISLNTDHGDMPMQPTTFFM